MNHPKQWRVLLTRDVTISTTLYVEADSAEQANDKALDMALQDKPLLSWDLDDGSASAPYIADPDATEEAESET